MTVEPSKTQYGSSSTTARWKRAASTRRSVLTQFATSMGITVETWPQKNSSLRGNADSGVPNTDDGTSWCVAAGR